MKYRIHISRRVNGDWIIRDHCVRVIYIYIDIFCKFCPTIYRNCKFCVTNLRTTCMRCTCNIHPPSSRGKKASRTAFKRLIRRDVGFVRKDETSDKKARGSIVESLVYFIFFFFLSFIVWVNLAWLRVLIP